MDGGGNPEAQLHVNLLKVPDTLLQLSGKSIRRGELVRLGSRNAAQGQLQRGRVRTFYRGASVEPAGQLHLPACLAPRTAPYASTRASPHFQPPVTVSRERTGRAGGSDSCGGAGAGGGGRDGSGHFGEASETAAAAAVRWGYRLSFPTHRPHLCGVRGGSGSKAVAIAAGPRGI